MHEISIASRNTNVTRSSGEGRVPSGMPLNLIRFAVLTIIMIVSFTVGAFAHAISDHKLNEMVFAGVNVVSYEPATDQYGQAIALNGVRSIVVERGDTLWKIAEQFRPDGMDIREYIYLVKQANHLRTSALSSGTVLTLPDVTLEL